MHRLWPRAGPDTISGYENAALSWWTFPWGIGLEIWQEKHAYFQNAQDFINVNYFENILQVIKGRGGGV